MKIYLLFIFLFLTVAFNSLKAQNYPYLNASTGNEGQYIVDADSNIYMFHNSQIEKVDKNFNPLWVKKYEGLSFYSLLLSKTGSVYFIAKDTIDYTFINSSYTKYVGKIELDGSLTWIKTIEHPVLSDIFINQLHLDRNSNLIISGSAGVSKENAVLIKLDTIGNMVFCKNFTDVSIFSFGNVTILEDSVGYYRCAYTANHFESASVGLFLYSENRDSIISQYGIGEYPQHYSIQSSNFYKSKFDSSIFYSITEHVYQSGVLRYTNVRKHNKNNVLWNKKFGSFGGSEYIINSFDEDENKNVIFTVSPKYGAGNNHTGFFNMCFKIDSTGFYGGQYNTLLSYNWWPPSSQYESAKLHVLNQKYIYDIIGPHFLSNPLSITQIDSTLITNCSSSTALPMSNEYIGPYYTLSSVSKTWDTPPYTLNDKTSSTTTITNFLTNPNYCLILNLEENKIEKDVAVHPSPVSHTLKIDSNSGIIESTVFDINGKTILLNNKQSVIDVSSLHSGLYFIKVKTDQGEFSQKFIKE